MVSSNTRIYNHSNRNYIVKQLIHILTNHEDAYEDIKDDLLEKIEEIQPASTVR